MHTTILSVPVGAGDLNSSPCDCTSGLYSAPTLQFLRLLDRIFKAWKIFLKIERLATQCQETLGSPVGFGISKQEAFLQHPTEPA